MRTPSTELQHILNLHKLRDSGDPSGNQLQLTEFDFSGIDLVGAHLCSALLSCGTFAASNLRGSDFHAAYAIDVDFSCCDMTGAFLGDATLDESVF